MHRGGFFASMTKESLRGTLKSKTLVVFVSSSTAWLKQSLLKTSVSSAKQKLR